MSAGLAVGGRHIFGEETCLSALPNNSTLVSLKSFLIIPAGKQKQYLTFPSKKLNNQSNIFNKIWKSIDFEELDEVLVPLQS
jgi:hypothetical protein